MKSFIKTYYQEEYKDDRGRSIIRSCELQINEDLMENKNWSVKQLIILSNTKFCVVFDIEDITYKNEGEVSEKI